MKLKWIVVCAGACALVAVLCCLPGTQGGNSNAATAFIALSGVSVPEMPAEAADLVAGAPAADRIQTGREVLRDVSTIARPGVLPYVVSAICRRNPETAGPIAAAAINLEPEDVLIFARAALCAASGQVEQIVFSAGRAAPASSADVAAAACQLFPAASESIRAGLVSARPDLELYLEEAEMKAGTNNYETVIRRSTQLFNDAARSRGK